jgi:hypothetical protein
MSIGSVREKIGFVTKLMAKPEGVDGAPIILACPTGDETHGGGQPRSTTTAALDVFV